MSGSTKAGPARTTSGSLSVKFSGDIVKQLRQIEKNGENAIKRTVSDFNTRAPGWVSKGIREHYSVDAGAIKDAAYKKKRGKTTLKLAGVNVDGVKLIYRGRLLTLTHFKMSPKQRPEKYKSTETRVPGQAIHGGSPVKMVNEPKPYRVKATIIKGKRVNLPAGTFVAQANGVNLPFQRTGKSRTPVEVVRTLSVPQMIDGRAKDTINQLINENMRARLQHNVERALK